VAELGWFLFSVGGAVTALALGALWLGVRPTSGQPRRFLAAAAMCYLLASSHAVGWALTGWLRRGFAPLDRHDVPSGRTAIVVLGSGAVTVRGWDRGTLTLVHPSGATRVLEAARVYALTGADWVIPSGGSADEEEGDRPIGLTMRDALMELGVPAERIVADTRSRDTYGEAVAIAGLLRSFRAEHVVLVTSATHMRRAAGTFRAQGVNVIPAIAREPGIRLPRMLWVVPTEAGLWETSVAAHEIVGLAYYAARGLYRGTP
jgi:uncharacterized SAM-binding protein YcdF (DUF218 family)